MKTLSFLFIFVSIVAYSQETIDTSKTGTIIIKKNTSDADTTVYTIVEEMPEFIGGRTALFQFISQNINYPDEIVNGTVYVNFIVEKDGSVNRVKIIRGIPNCSKCDEEALRVVKLMPKWKAGKQNGNLVRVAYNLPIKFSLK